MQDEPAQETAQLLAALWRRVRWGASVFCAVQFAAYRPSEGAVAPTWLLAAGLGLAAVVALANTAVELAERRDGARLRVDGHPARRDLVLLGADTVLTLAVVELFSFDPGVAVWALFVLPVLEAALLSGLTLALWTWLLCVAGLAASEVLAVAAYGLEPPSSPAGVVSSLGYRSGVLLLVALVVGVQATVTARYVGLLNAARRQLAHEASHDQLTGLASRGLFLDRARSLLGTLGPDRRMAMLYVDLDHFKNVNDSHGHAAGDLVLAEVARRLVATVRPGDTVARLGGDEFAVLLEGLGEEEARHVAERVRVVLARPYPRPDGEGELSMTCSVGVAMDEGEADRVSTLVRRADSDMYRHKGHNRRLRAL